MRLDIIYGLSGIGKTTLCKNIKDAYYIDIGHDKNFKKISMLEIFKNIFNENNSYNYYITEGCLYDINYRNEFIKNISTCVKADVINVFYLYIKKEELINFPKYKDISEIPILKLGCTYGNHYIIDVIELQDRINFIKGI